MATEFLFALLAVLLVWPLQMKISKKFTVVVAFGQRLILFIPIFLRLQGLDRTFKSHDPTLSISTTAIWKQVEITYAIVSASIPCLRPFMAALTTHYGAATECTSSLLDHYGGSGGKRRQIPETFILRDMNPKSHIRDNRSQCRNAETNIHSSTNAQEDSVSLCSNDSKQMIIQKKTEIVVDYDRHGSEKNSDIE